MVDLKNIELATEEGKQYQIDYWHLYLWRRRGRINVGRTKNEFIQEATETLYELNADETIRQQCLARQDYYRTQNSYKQLIEEQKQLIAKLQKELKNREN